MFSTEPSGGSGASNTSTRQSASKIQLPPISLQQDVNISQISEKSEDDDEHRVAAGSNSMATRLSAQRPSSILADMKNQYGGGGGDSASRTEHDEEGDESQQIDSPNEFEK
jgi:hypothetical protein